ncbi:MAG: hypothetical protein PUD50_03900 [Eubacteriales bacterium]|nr:hypothetical protein [Eubacteriales bacterium]
MQRNDYRRAVIMLRSMRNGYSGHARLEQRTLMGDLFVNASMPQTEGVPHVTLAGMRHGRWYAADAGTLRRDARGQAAGRFHFDPRNVSGRDMDEYALVLITLPEEPDAGIVLSGNLRSAQVDWAAMREAVRRLYHKDSPDVTALPDAAAAENTAKSDEQSISQLESSLQADVAAEDESLAEESRPEDDLRPENNRLPEENCPLQTGDEPSGNAETADEEAALFEEDPFAADAEPLPEPSAPEIVLEFAPMEAETQEEFLCTPEEEIAAEPDVLTESTESAEPEAEAYGAQAEPEDENRDAQAEPETSEPEMPEFEGYIFFRTSVPKGCGYPCAAIGLQQEDGQITGVCYALPGRMETEPPPGMEDYVWQDGWWITCLDIRS